MDWPEVKYARSGELSIAYQVYGDGPRDLVYLPFLISPIFSWLVPEFVDFYRRLASFSRLILLDRRGTGASDRPRELVTLEGQMDDVRAVLDDVGSHEAALFGVGAGAQVCALFAATHPERTRALVLYNAWARLPGTADDHQFATRATRELHGRRTAIEQSMQEQWPSAVVRTGFLQAMTIVTLATASPGAAAAFRRAVAEADVADVLPTIRVPTLILYRKLVPEPTYPAGRGLAAEAMRLAAAIPDARVVQFEGPDHGAASGTEITEEIERFLVAPVPSAVSDRVLATVLFTDLVGSTEQALALGDSAWRDLLARHRDSVRVQLRRFHGEEMDNAGDGFFASFDGPARAIGCAQAIIADASGLGLQVRAGVHTGECERDEKKLTGIAVHVGARISALAETGEVLLSQTVRDLVAGSGIEFEDRGTHSLKDVPGEWHLFAARIQ